MIKSIVLASAFAVSTIAFAASAAHAGCAAHDTKITQTPAPATVVQLPNTGAGADNKKDN